MCFVSALLVCKVRSKRYRPDLLLQLDTVALRVATNSLPVGPFSADVLLSIAWEVLAEYRAGSFWHWLCSSHTTSCHIADRFFRQTGRKTCNACWYSEPKRYTLVSTKSQQRFQAEGHVMSKIL